MESSNRIETPSSEQTSIKGEKEEALLDLFHMPLEKVSPPFDISPFFQYSFILSVHFFVLADFFVVVCLLHRGIGEASFCVSNHERISLQRLFDVSRCLSDLCGNQWSQDPSICKRRKMRSALLFAFSLHLQPHLLLFLEIFEALSIGMRRRWWRWER